MRKIIIVFFILSFITLLFANEKSSGNFVSLLDNLNIRQYSADNKATDSDAFYKTDKGLKIAHAILGGITYAGFLALDGIGIALTYAAFNNPDGIAYDYLQVSHLAVAIPAMVSFAALVTIGYTKVGLKAKAGYKPRMPHFVASFVTLGFYVLEIASIILSAVFFSKKLDNREWVGLSHGIICGLTTTAISVSIITIFL